MIIMFADAVVDESERVTESLSLAILQDYLKKQLVKKSQHPSTRALLYLESDRVPILDSQIADQKVTIKSAF